MVTILPLSVVSFFAMWIFAFIGFIFFKEGDDKRTLIFASCWILGILTVFTMLIPTFTITTTAAYNITTTNVPLYCTGSSNTIVSCGTTNTITQFPSRNTTKLTPSFSTPVITLYTIFGIFQSFLFFMFAFWSFRRRLEYKFLSQYEKELKVRRYKRE